MSSENATWSLLHIQSKLQIDSLSFLQTKALVQSFDDAEIEKWATWCEGFPDWQLLEEALPALGVTRKPKAAPVPPPAPVTPPKPPPFMGAAPAIANAQTGPSLLPQQLPETVVTQTGAGILNPDGRLSRRVTKHYKVYVGVRGKMHETMTVDLSLTGLQIVDGVPPGNDGNLEVALVNSRGENLSLICTVIPDAKRNRMKIVRAGKLDQLQEWLQNKTD